MMSDAKPSNFVNITQTDRPDALAGPSLGRSGVAIGQSAEDKARAWLLAQPSPEAADKSLLTSLQSSLGVGASFRTELRFPTDGRPAYSVTTGCGITLSEEASVPAAIQRIEGALTPPTRDMAELWLAMLQTACAAGRRSEAGSMLALELYSGALMRFPADIAKQACENLALRNRDETNWFPTLGELVGEGERMSGSRRALLAALLNHQEPSEADRKRERVRELLLAAKELDNSTFLMKRSDPERYAEIQVKVKSMRDEADRIRRGEDV